MKTAILLRKPSPAPPDIPLEFVGIDIEDVFVVGYGQDYGDLHRDLPQISVLESEAMGAGRKS